MRDDLAFCDEIQIDTVGKQDAKSGPLGTTFAVYIRLSSKFAGW